MHIGHKIKETFLQMPKAYTPTWFAEKLSCDRRNIYHIFERQSIDTELLRRICRILDHDFFSDLSDDVRTPRADK